MPYIGFSTEWAYADIEEFNTDAILLGGELGLKYFIRPNIALTGSIVFNWSTDDIYAVDEAFKDSATTLLLGMRFYF